MWSKALLYHLGRRASARYIPRGSGLRPHSYGGRHTSPHRSSQYRRSGSLKRHGNIGPRSNGAFHHRVTKGQQHYGTTCHHFTGRRTLKSEPGHGPTPYSATVPGSHHCRNLRCGSGRRSRYRRSNLGQKTASHIASSAGMTTRSSDNLAAC